ncbi:hypothetical protein V9T40_007759 [Parthenolecanium corni]|uniref:Uncharacterized protein n=1 Tax=Parthenolecanium corni TaxID=536013 RepID=A0AAN9Y4Z3_9HEMI
MKRDNGNHDTMSSDVGSLPPGLDIFSLAPVVLHEPEAGADPFTGEFIKSLGFRRQWSGERRDSDWMKSEHEVLSAQRRAEGVVEETCSSPTRKSAALFWSVRGTWPWNAHSSGTRGLRSLTSWAAACFLLLGSSEEVAVCECRLCPRERERERERERYSSTNCTSAGVRVWLRLSESRGFEAKVIDLDGWGSSNVCNLNRA